MLSCRDGSSNCCCCLSHDLSWLYDWFRPAFRLFPATTITKASSITKLKQLRLKKMMKMLLLLLLFFKFRFLFATHHNLGHLGTNTVLLWRLTRRNCSKWGHTTTSIAEGVYGIIISGAIIVITIRGYVYAPIRINVLKVCCVLSRCF